MPTTEVLLDLALDFARDASAVVLFEPRLTGFVYVRLQQNRRHLTAVGTHREHVVGADDPITGTDELSVKQVIYGHPPGFGAGSFPVGGESIRFEGVCGG